MSVRKSIRSSITSGRRKYLTKDIKIIIGVMFIITVLSIGSYLMYALKPTETKKDGNDEENIYITTITDIDGYNETIYPLGVNSGVNITGGDNPEEYGNWTEVIPSTYINQTFIITGFYVDKITANVDLYGVQIGIGDNNQTIYTILLHGSEVGSPKYNINYDEIDENTKISARCQSESGGNDSLLIWISYALID